MRVLVTGSHGFIGSQLVLALKERGDRVFCVDPKVHPDYRDLNLQPPEDLDEIYHLGCVNQEEAIRKPIDNVMTNAFSTRKWAEVAKEMGARFVYTSTASVYGDAKAWIPTPSHCWVGPKSDYAVAKLAGEHFVRNSGADYTIFRLSNVYGPGQTTDNPYCGVVAKFMEAAMRSEPLQIIGDGSQTRDFTYVEDILPHLMNPELKGVLNCSHGDERNIAGLYNEVRELFGINTRFEWAPERPVDGIQRRCLISDVTCPTDLKTGLQRTYDWLLAQNPVVSHSAS